MQPDVTTNYVRQRGWMPDWVWYQLNGKSAQENWVEQREAILADFTGDDTTEVVIRSEVKSK